MQTFRIGDFPEVTTPPAGWSPWPAARAHWGRWGGLFGSVAPYNVTKCDMRRPVCRSDVSVGRLTIKSPNGYARRAQIFGRGGARNAKENPSGPRFSAV